MKIYLMCLEIQVEFSITEQFGWENNFHFRLDGTRVCKLLVFGAHPHARARVREKE